MEKPAPREGSSDRVNRRVRTGQRTAQGHRDHDQSERRRGFHAPIGQADLRIVADLIRVRKTREVERGGCWNLATQGPEISESVRPLPACARPCDRWTCAYRPAPAPHSTRKTARLKPSKGSRPGESVHPTGSTPQGRSSCGREWGAGIGILRQRGALIEERPHPDAGRSRRPPDQRPFSIHVCPLNGMLADSKARENAERDKSSPAFPCRPRANQRDSDG
jgi:hypothetical protein